VDIAARLISIAIERQRSAESQESKLQSVVRHTAEGVVAVDEDRRILMVNTTARRFLGLAGDSESRLMEDAGLPLPLVDMLQRATDPDIHEAERVDFSVAAREYTAAVSPVVSVRGRRYGAIALLSDITAEVQYRRLQESFVANASHELRGPLTTLSATLEAMSDGLIAEPDRPRYLRSMLTEMERLRRLTHEISEMSRLDAGVEQLESESVDVGPLLAELRDKWLFRCASRGLSLVVDPGSETVRADWGRVVQVLTNLIENAVRYTPGSGSIRLSARREGNWVRVSVTDTGQGIEQEHLPHVWERFYKVDKARTLTSESGTGLGLAIVKRLVERMGGEVHVESAPEHGSVFSFTLPRE